MNKQDYQILKTIFNEVDPIGVAEEIDDEYEPEISEILNNISNCKKFDELKILVFEVIIKMLGDDVATRNDNGIEITNKIFEHQSEFTFKLNIDKTSEKRIGSIDESKFTSDQDILRAIFSYFIHRSDLECISDQNIEKLLKSLPRFKFRNDLKLMVYRMLSKEFGRDMAITDDLYLKVSEEILQIKDQFSFRTLI